MCEVTLECYSGAKIMFSLSGCSSIVLNVISSVRMFSVISSNLQYCDVLHLQLFF